MTCPRDLLIAASTLGLRGVDSNGEVVIEAPGAGVVASTGSTPAPARIILAGDHYEVVAGKTRFVTAEPCAAVVAAYNAYTDYILSRGRSRLERAYQILDSRDPGEKCGEWAGRILGIGSGSACKLVLLAASLERAHRMVSGDGSGPVLGEGAASLVEGVSRLSRARDTVEDVASLLASMGGELRYSRAGQVLAGRLLGFNPYYYAATGYSVCRLVEPSAVTVASRDGRGVLLAVELAWCSRAVVKMPDDPLAGLMAYVSYNGLDYPVSASKRVDLSVCSSQRCRRPFLDIGVGVARRAVSARIQGDPIVVYVARGGRGSGGIVAVLHGVGLEGVKDVEARSFLEASVTGLDETLEELWDGIELWGPV